jgi:hypothetical protein
MVFFLIYVGVWSPGFCICVGLLFRGDMLESVVVVFALVSRVTMFAMCESRMPVRVYLRW